jgi:hypothetical protein
MPSRTSTKKTVAASRRRVPTADRRRLEREVKAYAAAVRQDFLSGHRAVVQLTDAERLRAMT